MTRAVVGWSLRFRYLVLAVAAGLLAFGAYRLPTVPLGVVPDFNPPYVEVQTEALGLSATEVEQLITVPLEADLLQGVAFLDKIESESVASLSSIVLRFDPGTDIFRARQVVAERLTQAHALPNVSKPPLMLQPLSSTNRVLMASMTSNDVSLIDMSILARWTIRPRLLGVPGVANVAIWGLRERQLQVLVDPARLRDQRVALQHVLETAGNAMWVSPLTFLDASTPGTGGFIDTPNQRLGVQHVFPIRSAADLAKVPIAPEDTGGRIVLLGDVVEVVEDHQPLIGDAIVGGGPGLMLVIEKFPDADAGSVTRGVEEALAALQPGLTGIQIDSTVFRPASYVESAVASLTLAALIGLGLLVLTVLVLFRGWRAGLVVLLAIPLSLAAATMVLDLLDMTINAMTIAGLVLAIALIVDEAVIGVDAIRHRFHSPRDGDAGRSRPAIALEATLEGRGPILFGSLVTIAVAVPLFFATGIAGAFLPELALAYVLALVAAAVVALTLVPALSSFLLTGRSSVRPPYVIVERIQGSYARLLSRLLAGRRPRNLTAAAVALGLVAIVSAVVAPSVAGTLPSFRERQLLISWDAAPGTSRPEMDRIVGRASDELRTVAGVTNVGAHVGRAIVSDQVVGINAGEIWVTIGSSVDYDATVQAIDGVVAGYPGLDHAVVTYSNQRIDEVLASTKDDLVVRVYGHDLDLLSAKANEVRDAIASINGVASAGVDEPVLEPTLEIEVDLDAAQRYGIKAGDVRRAAAILLSGVEVGSIFEDQKVFSVVVWGRPEIRQNLTSIRDLPIQAPGGTYVRLADVADVRVAASPSVIQREGVFRRIDVGVVVNGRDLAAVTNDVESRVAGLTFPEEYHAEIRTVGAIRQADLARLLAIIAAALIWSFLLIQAAFSRWRLAALLFLGLPSAVLGSVGGILLTGGGASLGALLGGIAVLGIAVRQTILLVDRCRSLENADGETFDSDLVARAARERFVPILTTALATALALLPAIVLGDVAGLEIVRPMAVTIIAGLFTSTIFTLAFIPALYLQSGPTGETDPASQLLEQPGLSAA